MVRPGRVELPACGLGKDKPTAEAPLHAQLTAAGAEPSAETSAASMHHAAALRRAVQQGTAHDANAAPADEPTVDPVLLSVVARWECLPAKVRTAIATLISE